MKKILLILLLLPLISSAQVLKKAKTCGEYKDEIQEIADGLIHFYDRKKKVFSTLELKSASDFSIQPIIDQALQIQLQAQSRCEIEYFINTKARNKKSKEQLQQDYTILDQQLYKTSDNIVIGVQKTVTGNSYKIYSNTLIITDGTTFHSYTDYSEVDFNIKLFGATKTEDRFSLYGEEEKNQGSMYYGRFIIDFTPKKRVLSYELHLDNQ